MYLKKQILFRSNNKLVVYGNATKNSLDLLQRTEIQNKMSFLPCWSKSTEVMEGDKHDRVVEYRRIFVYIFWALQHF